MRQMFVLAIVFLCAGSASAMLGQESMASSTTSGNTIAQVSAAPRGVFSPGAVASIQEQQAPQAQKPSAWVSLWPYIAIGAVGTVVIMLPWLIVTGLFFQTFRRRGPRSSSRKEGAAVEE